MQVKTAGGAARAAVAPAVKPARGKTRVGASVAEAALAVLISDAAFVRRTQSRRVTSTLALKPSRGSYSTAPGSIHISCSRTSAYGSPTSVREGGPSITAAGMGMAGVAEAARAIGSVERSRGRMVTGAGALGAPGMSASAARSASCVAKGSLTLTLLTCDLANEGVVQQFTVGTCAQAGLRISPLAAAKTKARKVSVRPTTSQTQQLPGRCKTI